mmetsp:Transcript_125579/g.250545  ORF Transcript_125579/g.250545 Transcript_125579/m.250545 type:complete len:334 (-) Transcript_125579:104-1105(-)
MADETRAHNDAAFSTQQPLGSGSADALCPQGHRLQAWVARAGSCNRCCAPVEAGEHVLDCRWCNWYVCRACLPVYQAPSPSLVTSITTLPAYVIDQAVHDAGALLRKPRTCNRPSGESVSRPSMCTPRWQAASAVIGEFCEQRSAATPSPTIAELEGVRVKCTFLPADAVADAMCEQLCWVVDFAWFPKLRALHLVEHFHASGGASREAVNLVMARAGSLILQLTGVPQCKAKAIEVMRSVCQQMALECSTPRTFEEDQGSDRSEASTAPSDTDVNRSQDPKAHVDSEAAPPTVTASLVPSGTPARRSEDGIAKHMCEALEQTVSVHALHGGA